MKVGPVIDQFPQALTIFIENGFQTLANPTARKTFAKVISIDKACEKHGVSSAEILMKLNKEIFEKKTSSEVEATGKEIQHGEMCAADTRVGSLIKAYVTTKPVFEKHYGEGCFSCPGQVYETVAQTASMHNIDLNQILEEINAVIQKELQAG